VHRTGAALCSATPKLNAGQTQHVAKHLQQGRVRENVDLAKFTVHDQCDQDVSFARSGSPHLRSVLDLVNPCQPIRCWYSRAPLPCAARRTRLRWGDKNLPNRRLVAGRGRTTGSTRLRPRRSVLPTVSSAKLVIEELIAPACYASGFTIRNLHRRVCGCRQALSEDIWLARTSTKQRHPQSLDERPVRILNAEKGAIRRRY
jgi:hypothetical protein